jgi:hypothetical protein
MSTELIEATGQQVAGEAGEPGSVAQALESAGYGPDELVHESDDRLVLALAAALVAGLCGLAAVLAPATPAVIAVVLGAAAVAVAGTAVGRGRR